MLDNAIVVLAADHGQMFGEHGKWTHHNSLYEEVVRVPMLISWPGVLRLGANHYRAGDDHGCDADAVWTYSVCPCPTA